MHKIQPTRMATYLRSDNLVVSNKGHCLQKAAEHQVIAVPNGQENDDERRGDKGKQPHKEARRRAVAEVDVVEPQRKVVSMVLANQMVQVRLLEKLLAIA